MLVRAATAELSRGGLRRVLAVLCGTQITSWGVLYYAFPVLAPGMAADTGWSIGTVTAAFSLGLGISAVVGVPVGRLLDRYGPRPIMTTGSVVAVPAVLGIATARSLPWFFASWALAGVAMAGVLYAPAFAALTRWWGPRRVTALTVVTLLGGLASTVFAPLTAALDAGLGWRTTYLVLAGVLAVVTIPAHVFGLRGAWPEADPVEHAQDAGSDPRRIARSRPFVLLLVAVGLAGFCAFAVVVNQVPLFVERGSSTTAAAWALGLGGLGQVLGRLGYGTLAAHTGLRTRSALILGTSALAIVPLAVLTGPFALLVAAVMLVGAGRGAFTLLQATAVSERWGPAHYGRLNGIVSAPVMVATALAPWAGAASAEVLGGFSVLFGLLAGLAAVAAVLMLGTVPPETGCCGGQGVSVTS